MLLWIAGALSDIIESSFSKLYPKHDCICQFYITLSSVSAYFFPKCSPNQGCQLYMGTHYIRVNTVHMCLQNCVGSLGYLHISTRVAFHKNQVPVTAFFILNEYAAETRLLSVFQVCCQPCRERKTATFATRSHECVKESAEVTLSSLKSDAISQISIL